LLRIFALAIRQHLQRDLERARALNLEKRLQKFRRAHSDRSANRHKLYDIDSAFAALVFDNERLRLMEWLGEIVLGQTCAFSRFNHKIAESALAFRMDRFVEFART
jgi:hypothetical protein